MAELSGFELGVKFLGIVGGFSFLSFMPMLNVWIPVIKLIVCIVVMYFIASLEKNRILYGGEK